MVLSDALKSSSSTRRLPAEFEAQSFVQLIFPHQKSDWAPYLQEASATFVTIAQNIARFETCLIICDDIQRVKSYFTNTENIYFLHASSNDTWARDCSAITVLDDDQAIAMDFTFTGWGHKFEADLDNVLTSKIAPYYNASYEKKSFVLEGGAIESNGAGLLLTTSACLMHPNRNSALREKREVETILHDYFGTQKVLWLDNGYLAGDDTDSHIDTLARFVDEKSIVYLKCDNLEDEHFEALKKMEMELRGLKDSEDQALRCIALPMTEPIYYEGERLPASYANFLIINGAVLVPTYNDLHDQEALNILQELFPTREIVAIDCSVLIRQHGSLHCVTMQFPKALTLKY